VLLRMGDSDARNM